MLVYEKVVNGEKHVYATHGNVPADTDAVAVYKDIDGDALTLDRNDTYVNNDMHGITRLSDGKAFGVFVSGDQKAIIPKDWEPQAKVVKSIKIKTKPTKLSYIVGDALDLAGMVVEATYADGDKSDVTGYVVVPAAGHQFTAEEVGDVNVVVTFAEKTVNFKVTVTAE